MDTFYLQIDLGNDAMQTSADVAEALRKLADRLDTRPDGMGYEWGGQPYRVADINGNTVGEWSVTGE